MLPQTGEEHTMFAKKQTLKLWKLKLKIHFFFIHNCSIYFLFLIWTFSSHIISSRVFFLRNNNNKRGTNRRRGNREKTWKIHNFCVHEKFQFQISEFITFEMNFQPPFFLQHPFSPPPTRITNAQCDKISCFQLSIFNKPQQTELEISFYQFRL